MHTHVITDERMVERLLDSATRAEARGDHGLARHLLDLALAIESPDYDPHALVLCA